MTRFSQQKKKSNVKDSQAASQGRVFPSVSRYKNSFYGYCYLCKDFGHKYVDCRVHGTRRSNQINIKSESFPPFLRHIKCYFCDNIVHVAKNCKLSLALLESRWRKKKTWCECFQHVSKKSADENQENLEKKGAKEKLRLARLSGEHAAKCA